MKCVLGFAVRTVLIINTCIKRTFITLACANPNWTVWLCHTGKAEKSVGGCTSISVWC